jgi:hypothetical protein
MTIVKGALFGGEPAGGGGEKEWGEIWHKFITYNA